MRSLSIRHCGICVRAGIDLKQEQCSMAWYGLMGHQTRFVRAHLWANRKQITTRNKREQGRSVLAADGGGGFEMARRALRRVQLHVVIYRPCPQQPWPEPALTELLLQELAPQLHSYYSV
jgi:hypothetical protein